MPEPLRRPLHSAAFFLALAAAAYRLMFSSAAGGMPANGLADLLCYAAFAAYLLGMVRRDAPPLRINLAAGALALTAIALVIAARSSYYPRAGLEPLLDLAALVCLFLIISGTRWREEDSPLAAAYLAGIAAIPVAVGLYQHFYGFNRMIEDISAGVGMWVEGIYIGDRLGPDFRTRVEAREVFAGFYTSNVFAGFLALVIPVTLGLAASALRGAHGKLRGLLCGATGLALVALEVWLLFLTKSKGGLIAAAFAVAVFCAISFYRLVGWKTFLATCATVTLIAAAAVFANFPRARQTYYETLLSFDVRLGYWKGAWRMIQADYFGGVGPGNFGEVYVTYKDDAGREVRNPHNAFLLVCAEGGVFALLFFTSFWVLVLLPGGASPPPVGGTGAHPARAPAGEAPTIALAAVAAALAVYLATQGDFTGSDDYLTAAVAGGAVAAALCVFVLWRGAGPGRSDFVSAGLVAGVAGFLVHSFVDITFSDAGAATAGIFAAAAVSPRTREWAIRAGSAWAASLALLACAALVYFAGWVYVPLTQAGIALDEARAYVERGDLQNASERANAALSLDTRNTRPLDLLGAIYEASARAPEYREQAFNLARRFYSLALGADPMNRAAHEGLARVYEAMGPSTYYDALMERMSLILLYPSNSRYHVAAARLLEKAGYLPAALAHYRRALDINDSVEEHGMQFTDKERLGLRADVARLRAIVEEGAGPAPPAASP